MGLLYLQDDRDLTKALKYFTSSVSKDTSSNQRSELFRAQFAKAYYNMGMIQDRCGKTKEAGDSYKKAIEKCEGDPDK